jgi:multidrug efflux pump subunit AcrB
MIFTNLAVRFRTAMLALMGAIALAGIAIYIHLPREGAPDITIPYVFLTAAYEGVAPEEIENLIAIPLEKKLRDLNNLKEIRSTSAEGVCTISIEFTPDEDINAVQQFVKEKIDLARPDLPRDLDEPIVQAFNFSTDVPILMIAIHGDPGVERMRLIAEDLQDRIEALPGVKEASLVGLQEREIRVEFDPLRLQALSLSLAQVRMRLAEENRSFSAGNLELPDTRLQIRVPGEFDLAREMESLQVAQVRGRPVRLADVATITDTFKDLESISRFNGEPCVTLQIKKRSGENSVRLIRRIESVLADMPLPPHIRISATQDQSRFINSMVAELENNIASGFILVVAVILVVMGLRNSLLVGLAIPMSLFLGFIGIRAWGFTLNMLVLFSLVMAVGMLVDNSIVMVENIYRHHMNGDSRRTAALKGSSEVAWPVITSTLTTLAAFFPLVYWPGIMGQFMSYLPVTLILVLTASLVVAILMNPAICSLLVRRGHRDENGRSIRAGRRILESYERLLRWVLAHRALPLAIGVFLLVASVVVYKAMNRGLVLFPDVAPRDATVSVRLPQGTPIEKTDALLREIEGHARTLPDVKFIVTTTGVIGGAGMGGGQGRHLGAVFIEFTEMEDRTSDTQESIRRLRALIGEKPGADIKVAGSQMGPPSEAPISLEISGTDFDTLSDLSETIQRRIKTVPAVVDILSDFENARPEVQFRVDRLRASRLGVDTSTIGDVLRSSLFGSEATKLRAGEEQYDIMLRLPRSDRESLSALAQSRVTLPDGRSVSLSALGEFAYAAGRGEIRRKDQNRMITITAERETTRSVDAIIKEIRAVLADLPLPPGYAITYGGDTKDMNEAAAFLSKALMIGVGLIAVILIMQFNSLVLPVIILTSVVLSMMGVIWGLILCNMRFSVVMTGLGIISLAGVVVNNSIVLVDLYQRLKAEGVPAGEAVIQAGILRLRPVLLTAVTTILGLIPMAIGWSLDFQQWPPRLVAGAESGAWWAPMAVAIIFGLFFATTLTLIQVPVMCSLADSGIRWFNRKFGSDD